MSDLVTLCLHYGRGTVQTNEMGADLSEFQYTEVQVSSPKT